MATLTDLLPVRGKGRSRRARAACAGLGGRLPHPDVEEALLGVFEVIATDDADSFPAPAAEREATQCAGLEPDQERNKETDEAYDERGRTGCLDQRLNPGRN